MNNRKDRTVGRISANRVGATNYEISIAYPRGSTVAAATAYVDAERTSIFVDTKYGALTPGVSRTIRLTPNAWLTASQVVGAVYEFLKAAGEPVEDFVHTIREVVNYEGEFAVAA